MASIAESDARTRERGESIVCLARLLHLRHVPAVQLDVTGLRESLGHVPRERDRNQRVAATPDEQGIRLEPAQPGPETVVTVGCLEEIWRAAA